MTFLLMLFCAAESDDQNSVAAAEPQYTEVQTEPADPNSGRTHTAYFSDTAS